jgi:hypothetical protein
MRDNAYKLGRAGSRKLLLAAATKGAPIIPKRKEFVLVHGANEYVYIREDKKTNKYSGNR